MHCQPRSLCWRTATATRVALALAVYLQLLTAGITAAPLPPGTDLTAITLEAADGAEIVLGEGAYPGQIVVLGKTLTIRGAGDGATTIDAIAVEKGGTLLLHGVSIEPPADAPAAALFGNSALEISGCTVEGDTGTLFFVEQSRLALTDCDILGFVDRAIQVTDGGSLDLLESRISGPGESAIGAFGAASILVERSYFSGLGGAAIHAQDLPGDATITLRSSGFSDNRSVLSVYDSPVTLTMERNTIDALSSPDAAVLLIGSPGGVISGNAVHGRFLAVHGAGSRPLRIADNEVYQASEYPVVIDFNAAAASDGGEPVAPVFSGNRIIGGQEAGLLVEGAHRLELTGNTILNGDGSAVFVQNGASIETVDNVLMGSDAAIVFHSSAGDNEILGDDLLIGGISRPPGWAGPEYWWGGLVRVDGAPVPKGGAVSLGNDAREPPSAETEREAIRRAASDGKGRLSVVSKGPEIQARLLDAATAVLQARGAERGAALGDLLFLVGELRLDAEALAAIRMHASDMFGEQFYAEFTVSGDEGVFTADAGGVVFVEAGQYVVESPVSGEPIEVAVEPGEEVTAVLEAPRYLTLHFSGGLVHALSMKPQEQMRRALTGYRWAQTRDRTVGTNLSLMAVRRDGVEPGEIRNALALARAVADDAAQGLPDAYMAMRQAIEAEPRDDAAIVAARESYRSMVAAAARATRVLTAIGEAEDVGRILAISEVVDHLRFTKAAAWLENRLGLLDDSALIAQLQDEDRDRRVSAALALDRFRPGSADSVLIDALDPEHPRGMQPYLARLAAFALLGSPDPEVLHTMRAMVELRLRDQESDEVYFLSDAGGPAALHLLAFGNRDDHMAASQVRLRSLALPALSLLVSDPGRIGLIRLQYISRYDTWGDGVISDICPTVRSLPAPQQREAERALLDSWLELYTSSMRREDRLSGERFEGTWAFHLARSSCQAHAFAARAAVEGFEPAAFRWVAARGDHLRREFMPAEMLEEDLRTAYPDDPRRQELMLAFHRVATQLPLRTPDYAPNGIDRQALVIQRSDTPAGGLSIVAGLRVESIDGRLRFGLDFDLAHFRERSLAEAIANDPRSYFDFAASHGRTLISSVELRRGGMQIALADIGVDRRGELIFETKAELSDLTDLHLHVLMDMFGTKFAMAFPVFAGEFARTRPLQLAALETARAEHQQAPRSARATLQLAEALRATGEFTAALEFYQAALGAATGPQALATRHYISRQYADRNLYEEALALLTPGLGQATVAEYWAEAGWLRLQLAQYEAAAEAYERADALQANAAWRLRRGAALLFAGDSQGAVAALSAIDVSENTNPITLTLLLHMARVETGAGTEKTAAQFAEILARAERLNPDFVEMETFLDNLFADGSPAPERDPAVVNSFSSCQRRIGNAVRLAGIETLQERALADFEAAITICPAATLMGHLARHGTALIKETM